MNDQPKFENKFKSIERDPSNPMVIAHETFVADIARSILSAEATAVFRDMPFDEKMQAFINGVLTGLISILFSKVTEEGRRVMMQAVLGNMEAARLNAIDLVEHFDRAVAEDRWPAEPVHH